MFKRITAAAGSLWRDVADHSLDRDIMHLMNRTKMLDPSMVARGFGIDIGRAEKRLQALEARGRVASVIVPLMGNRRVRIFMLSRPNG